MAASNRRDLSRRYAPLTLVVVAFLMAIIVLPSALSLPQTNPTQTLEYAPVPPTDKQQAPPQGNVSALALGSSSSGVAGDASGGVGPGGGPPPNVNGNGALPRDKNCVGSPPRQTEDLMSPPCVAYFNGDNGGATYHGVTSGEVRVLIYADGLDYGPTDDGMDDESQLQGQYFDLGKPATGNETVDVRNSRRFAAYFNNRYQTYGRHVHFWIYFAKEDTNSAWTAETRRADATDNIHKLHPFAVITSGIREGFESVYDTAIAQAGVLVFGSAGGSQLASFYQRYAPLVWSFAPSVETRAKLFASFVCKQIVNRPVTDSGNSGENGKKRVLGFLSTTDSRYPGLLKFSSLVKSQTQQCGANYVRSETFPVADRTYQTQEQDSTASYATTNMTAFQSAGVTTIVWAGGYETDQSNAAGRANYYPEIVIGGDGTIDGNFDNTYQNQQVWSHAWVETPLALTYSDDRDACWHALHEADPNAGAQDTYYACNSTYYPDFRQLMTGIQVAGPRLTPQSIDQGFHAIPSVPSHDPTVASCYYEPSDYTCVKDATREWWDPKGGTTGGCWRMVSKGARFRSQDWPDSDINLAMKSASDPCNSYSPAPALF